MTKESKRLILQAVLFVVTFITTTLAGAEWAYSKSIWSGSFTWHDFQLGLSYSVPFLFILSAHEFGHYFTAVYHRVKTSLPWYIPLPPFPFFFGTLGAIIRIRERIPTTTKNFDIGIAGPLAGFVAAFVLLWYGFTHLPPPEYIFQFHPQYEKFGLDYAQFVYKELEPGIIDVTIGRNLMFLFFENFVADPTRVPNAHELIHYPLLFAGYLSLVFTALNLMPIGQLDGGHVVYGLFGKKGHSLIATSVFVVFVFYAGLGFAKPQQPSEELLWRIPVAVLFLFVVFLYQWEKRTALMIALAVFALQYSIVSLYPSVNGFSGWMLFAFILARFMRIQHPGAEIEEPLSPARRILGWIALLVFLLCFTPVPMELITTVPEP